MKRILKLIRLRFRAYMLEAQAEHACDLIEDHTVRYKALIVELSRVRRQIALIKAPSVILKEAALSPRDD